MSIESQLYKEPIQSKPWHSKRSGPHWFPRRKQYHSCDHCRKRRRACDAVDLGIDPFSTYREENCPNKAKACATCQKSGLHCTFKWLSLCSRDNLPRGVKNRLNTYRMQSSVSYSSVSSEAADLLSSLGLPPGYGFPITFELGSAPINSVMQEKSLERDDLEQMEDQYTACMYSDDANINCTNSMDNQNYLGFTGVPQFGESPTASSSSFAPCMTEQPNFHNGFVDEDLMATNRLFPKPKVFDPPSLGEVEAAQSQPRLQNPEQHDHDCTPGSSDWMYDDIFTGSFDANFYPSQTSPDICSIENDTPKHFHDRRRYYRPGVSCSMMEQKLVHDFSMEDVLAEWMAQQSPEYAQRKTSIEEELASDDPCLSLLGAGVPVSTCVRPSRHTDYKTA